MTPRLASSVGAAHTATPDGPRCSVPRFVLPVGFGSPTRWAFHTCSPSRIRSATTLPRKVQQGYVGSSDRVSSHEATGTNTLPS